MAKVRHLPTANKTAFFSYCRDVVALIPCSLHAGFGARPRRCQGSWLPAADDSRGASSLFAHADAGFRVEGMHLWN